VSEVLDRIGEELHRAAKRRVAQSERRPRVRRMTSWLFAPAHDGRWRSRWRSPRLLGVLAAALAVSAACAYAAVRLAAPVSAIPPAVAQELGVFARPAASTDRPSTSTVISSDLKGLASLGYVPAQFANPRLAREVMTTSEGASIYLVPTEAGACLLDSSRVLTATCASLPEIRAARGIESTTCSPYLNPTEVEIGGIVPDAVADPRVIFSDGSMSRLHVENNVFVLRTSKTGPLPVKIAWSLDGKRIQATVANGRPGSCAPIAPPAPSTR
jgi:hypothetical protein